VGGRRRCRAGPQAEPHRAHQSPDATHGLRGSAAAAIRDSRRLVRPSRPDDRAIRHGPDGRPGVSNEPDPLRPGSVWGMRCALSLALAVATATGVLTGCGSNAAHPAPRPVASAQLQGAPSGPAAPYRRPAAPQRRSAPRRLTCPVSGCRQRSCVQFIDARAAPDVSTTSVLALPRTPVPQRPAPSCKRRPSSRGTFHTLGIGGSRTSSTRRAHVRTDA
jgi:hypothetical protein